MKLIKSRQNTSYAIFHSSGFLIGLAVLFLNDFILKAQFHNWLTGKLSDFAGLFVFALFWSAFFPKKPKEIYIAIAAFFIFWKSPLSEPFIQSINSITSLNYSRVVDWMDLIALFVLPFAEWYRVNARKYLVKIPVIIPISIASFLFVATSIDDIDNAIILDEEFELNFPQDSLFKKLDRIDSLMVFVPDSIPDDSVYFGLSFYSFNCEQRMHIDSKSFALTDSTCKINFQRVYEDENCYKVADPKKVEESIQNLRDELENEIIDKLQ